LEANTGSVTL